MQVHVMCEMPRQDPLGCVRMGLVGGPHPEQKAAVIELVLDMFIVRAAHTEHRQHPGSCAE